MKSTLIITAAAFASFQIITASCQTTAFQYQGRLNDGSNRANGQYNFQFTLYDAPTNGDAVAVSATNLFVTNGLFTALLDFGSVFNGSNYWMEIAAQTNGGSELVTLSPRQPITSAPYAITANSAMTVAGPIPASQVAGVLSPAQIPPILTGTFDGDGSGLTGLNAAAVTGSFSPGVSATNLTLTGVVTNGMFVNVQAFGAIGNGVADDTSAVLAALQAANANGWGLYFPGLTNIYVVNSPLLMTNVPVVLGDSMGEYINYSGPTNGTVVYVGGSPNGNGFVVSNCAARFANLAVVGTHYATRGADIVVANNGGLTAKVDFESVTCYTGFIGVDVQEGAYWVAHNLHCHDQVYDGIRINNQLSADFGDWCISDSTFIQYWDEANAAIDILGSGGGKIENVKINCDTSNPHYFTNGVKVLLGSQSTSQLLINNISIEWTLNENIYANTNGAGASQWDAIEIANSYFSKRGYNMTSTNSFISLNNHIGDNSIIDSCMFKGAALASCLVSLNNVDSVAVSPVQNQDASTPLFGGTSEPLSINWPFTFQSPPSFPNGMTFLNNTYFTNGYYGGSGSIFYECNTLGVQYFDFMYDGVERWQELVNSNNFEWFNAGQNQALILDQDGDLSAAGTIAGKTLVTSGTVAGSGNLLLEPNNVSAWNITPDEIMPVGGGVQSLGDSSHPLADLYLKGQLVAGAGSLLVSNISAANALFTGTVSGTFNNNSDRNAKRELEAVDPTVILDGVARLPVSKWSYKTDGGTRHIGPMAQDFYAAFAVGSDNRHIATVDEEGVALAAIQGLNRKLDEKAAEVERLTETVKQLQETVQTLKSVLSASQPGAGRDAKSGSLR